MAHELNTITLITEVEKRPALFNTHLREFYDKNLKDELWAEVCREVVSDWNNLSASEKNKTGCIVQRRWKSLRDCFRRYLRQQSGGIDIHKKKYIYFNRMSFLASSLKDLHNSDSISSLVSNEHEQERAVDDGDVETYNSSQKRWKQQKLQADTKRVCKGKWKEHSSSNKHSSSVSDECGGVSENITVDLKPSTRFPKQENMQAQVENSGEEKLLEQFFSGYNHLPVSVALEEPREDGIEDGSCSIRPHNLPQKQQYMPQDTKKTFGDMLLDVLKDRAMEDIDEDKAFLMSLFPGFKKLNDDQKFTVKMEFLQVMRRVQLKPAQGPFSSAAMPEYKLIYFNAKGRAELIRWIFAYGNIPYTDERIELSDWQARKPTIYTNKVPILMVDGIPLPESLAIARYLAKQAGLVPEDNFLAAKVDAGIDQFADIHLETRKILRSPISNEEKAKQMREELFPNVLKPFLTKLNKDLEGRDWYVGDKVSWLDFNSASTFDNHKIKIPNLLDDFPNVDKHMKRVMDLPSIKEWVAKRPQTFL